ncbi:Uncharacterised protein [Vibrio cholerae]|nr:Uncharacterised protein [Vibrio cholerae]
MLVEGQDGFDLRFNLIEHLLRLLGLLLRHP